jgi:membrane protein DedA with SNARE-associated domain
VERHVLTSVAAALSSGPPPVLPGFLAPLGSPLEHYGLWAIALFVLVEDFGIPVPGETVLIAGAVFAGAGRLNVVAVGIVGFIAAVAGDNIGYAIGRFGGRALVERWGRYVFLTSERLDKAERFFARHGGKIIVVARFIEGLRQANGIIAGITGMRWLKFLAFNALGAALWVGTWVSVGYFAGQHITSVYDAITNYSLYAAIAAVVLIAAWILFHLRKRRRARGAAAAETGAADARSAETVPAELEPAETRSADARSADARSADARSADARSADARSAETRSAETASKAITAADRAAGTPGGPTSAAGNGATAPGRATRTPEA